MVKSAKKEQNWFWILSLKGFRGYRLWIHVLPYLSDFRSSKEYRWLLRIANVICFTRHAWYKAIYEQLFSYSFHTEMSHVVYDLLKTFSSVCSVISIHFTDSQSRVLYRIATPESTVSLDQRKFTHLNVTFWIINLREVVDTGCPCSLRKFSVKLSSFTKTCSIISDWLRIWHLEA